MASAALASSVLRPPRRHYPPVPPPRAHPATTTAPRPRQGAAAIAASVRCLAVAADELSIDPSFPEGEDRALSGVAKRPEADVVVISSGIGGLCCTGLLARYSQDVLVLERYDRPGGAAHSFDIKGFNLDSGPSLFSGFQSRGPQVLNALGESVPCADVLRMTTLRWFMYLEANSSRRLGQLISTRTLRHMLVLMQSRSGKGFCQCNAMSVVNCPNLPGLPTKHQDVDIVIIRENSEGEYSGLEHEVVPGVVESLKVWPIPCWLEDRHPALIDV